MFKGVSAFFVGIVCIGIMAALFFSWTPLGSQEIEGIQGRYFLPVLPIVLLLLQNNIIYIRHRNIDKYLILSVGYLQCLVAFFVTLTAIGRCILYYSIGTSLRCFGLPEHCLLSIESFEKGLCLLW